MRVCIVSVEIFAWGKYGGFGRATRLIGRELASRGIEVFAVVPKREDQRDVEYLDGITVLGFSPYAPWKAFYLLKQCNADIYHSFSPTLSTYLAQKALPHKKHIVTLRDPKDFKDWIKEFERPSLNKWQVFINYLYEYNVLVRNSIKKMDRIYTIANYLIPKAKTMYRLQKDVSFLPTPVAICKNIKKAETPTVCYLARMDRRKRPELFLALARKFPYVKFLAIGKSRDKKWENELKKTFGDLSNLEFLGFIDQFTSDQHQKLREKSWIMVNCATREAFPNSFIEASAAKCAILSYVNPDNFASNFGFHAKNDNFEEGLNWLLENNRWQEKGEMGYRYIREKFQMDQVIQKHIDIYKDILKKPFP